MAGADEKDFQDVAKHQYFNTNNIWLNLERLQEILKKGPLKLPLIANGKRVDPSSKGDPGFEVVQVETAMGAAISLLPGAEAILVPPSRFLPVKNNSQLAVLRGEGGIQNQGFWGHFFVVDAHRSSSVAEL